VSRLKTITINEFENDFSKLEGKSVCVDIKGSINLLKVITNFNVWQDENKITLFDHEDESEVNIKKDVIDCIVKDRHDTSLFLKNGMEVNVYGQEDVDHE